MRKWLYGDSWEAYPIEAGRPWGTSDGSVVAVHDIRDPLPGFMLDADMVFCDPPWNQGNVNTFVTKAGLDAYVASFNEFLDPFFNHLVQIAPRVVFLEMGKQSLSEVLRRLAERYKYVQHWPITYYHKHPCFLIRASTVAPTPVNYCGIDDEDAPFITARSEQPTVLADLCTGRGLTLQAAHDVGAVFRGTELNKRRLAVSISKGVAMGQDYHDLSGSDL